jgi:hypothetical protein
MSQTQKRKAKSLESERNLNTKYKLENTKFIKEFSQDFKEELKVSSPTARQPQKTNKRMTKVYESDSNQED